MNQTNKLIDRGLCYLSHDFNTLDKLNEWFEAKSNDSIIFNTVSNDYDII